MNFIINFFLVLTNLISLSNASPYRFFFIGRRIDMNGNTDLHKAAGEGDFDRVIEFYVNGENMDIENFSRDTPLCEAAFYGHEDVAKFLINVGADVNHQGCGLKTPLYQAAFNGKARMVELLLNRGANIDLRNHIGWTPLFAACRFGHEAIVKKLLQYGAKVNLTDETGRSLQAVVELSGNINIINMIAEAMNEQNPSENTTYPCDLKEIDENTWICYGD
ncbi:ankyrin repeat domain-containing protein 50-like [Contarinia nasturtii]|uniref:ankyrin repeat domain-containing protein 50-like n=1 Tax=Contarinia nasturtii TaxID=265458 RepID=UPI0012D487CF|nr:ankyrin repeat domain-containing protein 50-like [Contarinia nasturtii]